MTQQKNTFCRICEPLCPIVASYDNNGRVIGLAADHEHVSGGLACHKGLSFLDLHNDPDRLNWPLKRLNPRREERGDFAATDWETAMAEIGVKLRALRAQYGPDCVAFYLGNSAGFNASGLVMAGQFQNLINTKMRFSAGTQDTNNKMLVSEEVYGSVGAAMVPDIYHTDYLLCLGANPKVSRWTYMSAPNNGDIVKQIRERGGKVRFVNPRKIESSTLETGPTLLIKPGSDVYFLAAVLNEIERRGGFDEDLLARHGKHVEGLRQFARRFDAAKVAGVTGIAADDIREVAAEIVAAKSAAVYMATGVNQSRQGVLCSWLVEMINFASGNLGRAGGTYKPNGLVHDFSPKSPTLHLDTSLGRFALPGTAIAYSVLPAVLLPDLIENGDIRALIIYGGNPILSVGGEARMRKACESLEMMITMDIFRNATGELSDFVLPATDWMERADINLVCSGLQAIPYVQYTDALEAPAFGRRHEWWIMSRLAQEMGAPSPLDMNPDDGDGTAVIEGLLSVKGLSIEALRGTPGHTAGLAQDKRDSAFDLCLQHEDKKIDCCPLSFETAGLFKRCDAIFAELENEPDDVVKLISLRTPYIHNSWMSNTEKFTRGKQSTNPLHMCERDAAARGLHQGDLIRVYTDYGELETRIFIDDDLRPGVVAMSHGFGHKKSYGLSNAAENPGVNCNVLMPVGAGTYEPLSFMSWLSGVPVEVEKIAVS